MTDSPALWVDISPWSPQQPADWPRLAEDDRFRAVIIKAGEGRKGNEVRNGKPWLLPHVQALRSTRLLVGLYWYLHVWDDGAAQADAFADVMHSIGRPDLVPVVDLEEGSGNDAYVQTLGKVAGRNRVVAVTRAFIERLRERTGQGTVLYGGGWMRSVAGREAAKVGADGLWLAAYVSEPLDPVYYEGLGFELADLVGWQFLGQSGDGVHTKVTSYPHTTPIGDTDISVEIDGGIERMRWQESGASLCATGPAR